MTVTDGDIIRGVVSGTMVNGDEFKNVFTWVIQKISLGDWTDAEIGTFVTDCIEAIMLAVQSEIATATTFDTVDIYKFVAGVWDYLTTTVPDIDPDGVGDVTPAGVAMLMTAYTNRNKVFGRKFIYGVTEGNVTTGFLFSTALDALADAAALYIASYTGGTMGPLDFLVPGVYSSAAADFVPFNGIAVVKNILSYQRRRKSGVGV